MSNAGYKKLLLLLLLIPVAVIALGVLFLIIIPRLKAKFITDPREFKKVQQVLQHSDWPRYEDPKLHLSFIYPPEASVSAHVSEDGVYIVSINLVSVQPYNGIQFRAYPTEEMYQKEAQPSGDKQITMNGKTFLTNSWENYLFYQDETRYLRLYFENYTGWHGGPLPKTSQAMDEIHKKIKMSIVIE